MLSDVIRPSIVELGKIKIGGKGEARQKQGSTDTWRMPVKYDHFIVTTLNRDKNGDLIRDDDLMNQLVEDGKADSDGKLRQLPIALLSNEIEDIVQARYVWYQGKKLAARSDGVTLTVFYDTAKNAWFEQPQEREWKSEFTDLRDKNGNKIFKLHTVFNCVISARQSKWGGFYRFRTTSEITAGQLVGSLMHLKELTGGVLRGLPLRLAIRPMQVTPMVKGTPQVSTVYVVHVELLGSDLTEIQNMALERARWELAHEKEFSLTRNEYRKLLTAPGEYESEHEQAEIAEEFHPENGNGSQPAPQLDPLQDALGLNGEKETTGSEDAPVLELT